MGKGSLAVVSDVLEMPERIGKGVDREPGDVQAGVGRRLVAVEVAGSLEGNREAVCAIMTVEQEEERLAFLQNGGETD